MRCQFRYPSGAQCVGTAGRNMYDMCADHRLITERREEKRRSYEAGNVPSRPRKKPSPARRASTVQTESAVLPKLPPVVEHHGRGDPTAPWCTCQGACACDLPPYDEWARTRSR